MKAELILENGARFKGELFGCEKETVGEVVFTTGMTGYQESMTDPSSAGKIVTMTFPLVGNYGVNSIDMESDKAYMKALIVREVCDFPSNFRCEKKLSDFMKENGVVGLAGIDTRELTKIIRKNGSMKGAIVIGDVSDEDAFAKIKSLDNSGLVMECTTKESYVFSDKGNKHIAYIDLGTRKSMLNALADRNCKVTVFPADVKSEDILAVAPDAVFVSSGPGDVHDIPFTVDTVKELIGKLPVYGISLGHHVISLALGGVSEKMKFGHHGGNHPVKEMESGRVYITSQSHDFVVSGFGDDVEITFKNVNDGSCEGIRHKTHQVESVQFHPESSPGPLDTGFIFDRFLGKED